MVDLDADMSMRYILTRKKHYFVLQSNEDVNRATFYLRYRTADAIHFSFGAAAEIEYSLFSLPVSLTKSEMYSGKSTLL